MGANFSTDSSVAPPSLEDFVLLAVIGQGAFGKVWQVRKKDNGRIYAMKVLKKKDVLEANLVERATLEMEIMAKLGNHPFIMSLHYAFQNGEKLYLVMDYMSGGSLFGHIRKSPVPFSEDVVRFMLAETILALSALHNDDIVYRDLKLENILLDSDGHVRLTDFGLSAKMKKGRKIHDYSGTAVYLAPEIVTDIKGTGHGKSVDIWSLGVLSHLLLTQKAPYWHPDTQMLLQMIRTEKVSLVHCSQLSPECQSLLSGLLVREPRLRLGCGPDGIEEIKHHPFFRDVDWEALLNKEIESPYKPGVKNETDYSCLDADAHLPEVNDSDIRLLAELQRQPNKSKRVMGKGGMGKRFSSFQYVKGDEQTRERELSPTGLSTVRDEFVAEPNIGTSSDEGALSPPHSPREMSTSPSLSPQTSPPMSPERSRMALSPDGSRYACVSPDRSRHTMSSPEPKDDLRRKPKFSLAKIKSMFSDEEQDDEMLTSADAATTATTASASASAAGGMQQGKKGKSSKFRIAKKRPPRKESSPVATLPSELLGAEAAIVKRSHKKTSSAPASERSRTTSLSLSSAQIQQYLLDANPEGPSSHRVDTDESGLIAIDVEPELEAYPVGLGYETTGASASDLPSMVKKKKKKRHRRRIESELASVSMTGFPAAPMPDPDPDPDPEALLVIARAERTPSCGEFEEPASGTQLSSPVSNDFVQEATAPDSKSALQPLRADLLKKNAAQRQRELQEQLGREQQERQELWSKLQTRQLRSVGQDDDERAKAFRDERARIEEKAREDRLRADRLKQEEAERVRREKELEAQEARERAERAERERKEREEAERESVEARRKIERFTQRLQQIEAEREEANRQLSLYEKKPSFDASRPLSEELSSPSSSSKQESGAGSPSSPSTVATTDEECVPYHVLVSHPEHLDRLNLEKYLSTSEFREVFQIDKAAFYALPKWKQCLLKRNNKLL